MRPLFSALLPLFCLLAPAAQAVSVDYPQQVLVVTEAQGAGSQTREFPVSTLSGIQFQIQNAGPGAYGKPMPGMRIETMDLQTSGGVVRIQFLGWTATRFVPKPNTTAGAQTFMTVRGRGNNKTFDVANVAAIDFERLNTGPSAGGGPRVGVRVERILIRLRSGAVEQFSPVDFGGITFEHKPFVKPPAPPPSQPKVVIQQPKPQPIVIKP